MFHRRGGIGFNYADSMVDTVNYAVFGQADWDLTEDLTASLGLRYTHDKIDYDFYRAQAIFSGPYTALPALPAGELDISGGTTDSAVTGRFALSYDISDNIMVFSSYAEGYKSPAYDLIFGTTADRLAPVPAELSTAWEAGVRSELFDRRLRLTVNAFHTLFENFQGQAFNPENVTFLLTSAGEVKTQGVEIEFSAKPVPELLINGGIAFIDATYDEYKDSACYFGQTEALGCSNGLQNITGGDVPNSPDTKITLSAKYNFYLDGDIDMFIGANYRWREESQTNENQAPYLILPSYGVLDLNAGIQADDGKWVLSVFAKNALDDEYVSQLATAAFDASNVTMYLTRDYQRYIGAEFTYRFGSY